MSFPLTNRFFVFQEFMTQNIIWMRLTSLQHIIANHKLIEFLLRFLKQVLILFFPLNGVMGNQSMYPHYCRMLHHLDSTRFPTIPDCTTVGSPIISSVLKTVCPRYHFAGSLVQVELLNDLLEHLLRASTISKSRMIPFLVLFAWDL